MNLSFEPLIQSFAKELTSQEVMPLFAKAIAKEVANEMQQRQKEQKAGETYLSGSEVNKLFKISTPTRFRWEKKKILTKHKIQGKTLYKRSEIEAALTKMESVNL